MGKEEFRPKAKASAEWCLESELVSIAEAKSKDGCKHKIALNDIRSSCGYMLYILGN